MNMQEECENKFEKANELYFNKQYKDAIRLYQECFDMADIDEFQFKNHCIYNIGTAYIKLHDFNMALFYYKQILENDENNKQYKKIADVYFNIGFCHSNLNDYYLAYKAFKKSNILQPNDPATLKAINLLKIKILK